MIYILTTILFILLSIFLIDLFNNLFTWQSRIHIGRWKNQEIWKKALIKKSKTWLQNTPTIPISDNKRLIVLDILNGHYKSKNIQSWQKAAILLGLIEIFDHSNDATTKKVIQNFINNTFEKSDNWKEKPVHIDTALLAFATLKVKWIDKYEHKPAFDFIYNLINEHIGSDRTVMYRKNKPDFRYVDSIGFICPFLVNYGKSFNEPKAIELAVKQIEEFNKYALLKDTGIPAHTYNINTKLPVGLFGWGRGMAWYAIGLMETCLALPNEHKEKANLTKYISKFTNTILSFQNDNGSWNWQILEKGTRADSSVTAVFAWFLKNTGQFNIYKDESETAYRKAINYLMKVTRRNGVVDFSQGDTKGIGVYSQNFDKMPFTQGFALRSLYQ